MQGEAPLCVSLDTLLTPRQRRASALRTEGGAGFFNAQLQDLPSDKVKRQREGRRINALFRPEHVLYRGPLNARLYTKRHPLPGCDLNHRATSDICSNGVNCAADACFQGSFRIGV